MATTLESMTESGWPVWLFAWLNGFPTWGRCGLRENYCRDVIASEKTDMATSMHTLIIREFSCMREFRSIRLPGPQVACRDGIWSSIA
jgi:hypothetical protein